jgi:hypothetical protein
MEMLGVAGCDDDDGGTDDEDGVSPSSFLAFLAGLGVIVEDNDVGVGGVDDRVVVATTSASSVNFRFLLFCIVAAKGVDDVEEADCCACACCCSCAWIRASRGL